MPSELRPLVRAASLRRAGVVASNLYRGRVGNAAVVATMTGIGTAAAARAANRLLDAEPLDHMIVVGIAGAAVPIPVIVATTAALPTRPR